MRITKLTGVILISMVFMFSAATAGTDIGLKGIGGKLGYVMPSDDIDNTFGLGLFADLGTFTPDLHFDAFFDFWSKGYDFGAFDASITMLVFGAEVKYYFPLDSNIEPYAGGGLGFHIGMSKVEYEDPWSGNTVEDSESDTDFGLHLLGGAKMELSPTLDGFGELRFATSEVDYFSISVGVIYKLGK